MTILLIADDATDSALLRELIAGAFNTRVELIVVREAEHAIEQLRQQPIDLVLLRVSTGGTAGLNTFRRIAGDAVALAVIAITAAGDEEEALAMVRAGAQECLQTNELTPSRLRQSIHHAIERQRQLNTLRAAHERERRERDADEIESLEALSHETTTKVTAQIYGATPLREALPGIFAEVVDRYAEIVERNLEQRLYKVSRNISDPLRDIAEQLGFLRAGPRDVIELHTLALKRKINESTSNLAQAYVEEGRLLVLELMGYLTVYYRNHSFGARRATPTAAAGAAARNAKDASNA